MLSEREQSYYGELFQTCDVEGTGKFSGLKVSELFRSSGLSQDVLQQITELCGAKRLGHFGRSQFYIALKLIAAAQCGLPVSHDSINSGIDIPLPKFHKSASGDQAVVTASQTNLQGQDNMAMADRQQQQGQLPPPPTSTKKSHSRNLSGQFRGHTEAPPLQIHTTQVPNKDGLLQDTVAQPFTTGQSQTPAPPKNPQSPPTSPQVTNTGPAFSSPTSPSAAITNSYSSQPPMAPLPVQNLIQNVKKEQFQDQKGIPQKGTEEWARFESDDEKHGLLGHGKKEEWDNLKLPEFDSSSISSDTESVEDVWAINDEQRDYYVKQFNTIEKDPNGHISGAVAKEFFEKSKLSNSELSKIWNLSDLNHDGALSIEEFCIAMHLVVLRRNDIEVPERLPFSLMPYNAFTNEDHEPFAADLPQGSTLKRLSPNSPPEALAQWESPQISSSEVSSPSITPANFDFQKPEPSDHDAMIIQPKARRMSPETLSEISETRPERGRAFSEIVGSEEDNSVDGARSEEPNIDFAMDFDDALDPTVPSSGDGAMLHDSDITHAPLTKQRSNTATNTDHNHVDAATASLQSRPRPLAKRNTVPGALPGHILPPVPPSSQPISEAGEKHLFTSMSVDGGTDEPPAPPPRPGQHGRSLSVDYKAPPAVPPRVTDKDAPTSKLAQFKHFEAIQSQEVLNLVPGSSATTTIPSVDRDRNQRSKSLDYRKTTGLSEHHETSSESKTAVAWDLLGDDFADGSAERQAEFALAAQRQAARDKKELHMAIRTHKERNSMLSRLNSELNQELQEVMEQRIALEIQLEHLRPFSS